MFSSLLSLPRACASVTFMTQDFQGHVTLKLNMSSWIKIVILLNVSLNYISCLDYLSKSLSYGFAGCFQSYMNRVFKLPRVSNSLKDYGVLEVKYKRKWFLDLFLLGVFDLFEKTLLLFWSVTLSPGTVHSNIQQHALQVWRLVKFRSGWPDGWFWKLN